jgi:hypothetical protein
VFRLRADSKDWRTKHEFAATSQVCDEFPVSNLLPRRVAYPKFEIAQPPTLVSHGTIERTVKP